MNNEEIQNIVANFRIRLQLDLFNKLYETLRKHKVASNSTAICDYHG